MDTELPVVCCGGVEGLPNIQENTLALMSGSPTGGVGVVTIPSALFSSFYDRDTEVRTELVVTLLVAELNIL